MEPEVPLFRLELSESDRRAVDETLASGWLTSGPRVQAFEARFAELLGVDDPERVVAVSSCTAAQHLSLAALGVGPGDEVIVPALTFVASANVVAALGAVPVFADIVSLDEPTLCPDSLGSLLSPRSRAIVPVHYAGYPCRMGPIRAVAREHGLAVVEDAAHSCITRTPAGACGTLGDAGAFSFFSNKNLAVGEGGAAVLGDLELASRVRRMRSHGMTTVTLERHRGHAFTYDVREAGFNYRWDDLRAALALNRLERLPAELAERRRLAAAYRSLLAERCPDLGVPFSRGFAEVPAHVFPVLLPGEVARGELMARLRAEGVQTSIHYPLVPGFTLYQGRARGSWPRAAEFCARVLTLPFFPAMRAGELERVVSALARGLEACTRR